MSTTFVLSRYEDNDLLDQLDVHRAKCRTCRLSSVTRVQGACFRAQQIHEQVVRAAQREMADRNRQAPPRWQKLDLVDLSNEFEAVDYLRAIQVERSSLRETWKRLTGRPTPRQDATIQGIDVSFWQGGFPWGEAVNQGIQLGIAKSSEGVGYTDPQWGANMAALLAPGPLVGGSYHFARPDLGNSAAAEADWYLGRHPAGCFSPTVPWVFSLDAESAGGNASWVYEFLASVGNRTGYTCWFYSYESWISSRGVQAYGNPLWIAWPNSGAPPNMGWPAITSQQYGTRGFSVGQVDADVFLGDLATLYVLGGVSPTPPPSPVPVPVPPPPLPLPAVPSADTEESMDVAYVDLNAQTGWQCFLWADAKGALWTWCYQNSTGKVFGPGPATDSTGTAVTGLTPRAQLTVRTVDVIKQTHVLARRADGSVLHLVQGYDDVINPQKWGAETYGVADGGLPESDQVGAGAEIAYVDLTDETGWQYLLWVDDTGALRTWGYHAGDGKVMGPTPVLDVSGVAVVGLVKRAQITARASNSLHQLQVAVRRAVDGAVLHLVQSYDDSAKDRYAVEIYS